MTISHTASNNFANHHDVPPLQANALMEITSASQKPTTRVNFKPFDFLVQQHDNTKPTESMQSNMFS